MKIDCKKIINAYSVAVVKDIEKELNYIQYLESLSSDPANVGKNVICPVCRNLYYKESVAQKTCSTRCNLGLYNNLSIRALRQMSASPYRLAVSVQDIMAQIRYMSLYRSCKSAKHLVARHVRLQYIKSHIKRLFVLLCVRTDFGT